MEVSYKLPVQLRLHQHHDAGSLTLMEQAALLSHDREVEN